MNHVLNNLAFEKLPIYSLPSPVVAFSAATMPVSTSGNDGIGFGTIIAVTALAVGLGIIIYEVSNDPYFRTNLPFQKIGPYVVERIFEEAAVSIATGI